MLGSLYGFIAGYGSAPANQVKISKLVTYALHLIGYPNAGNVTKD